MGVAIGAAELENVETSTGGSEAEEVKEGMVEVVELEVDTVGSMGATLAIVELVTGEIEGEEDDVDDVDTVVDEDETVDGDVVFDLELVEDATAEVEVVEGAGEYVVLTTSGVVEDSVAEDVVGATAEVSGVVLGVTVSITVIGACVEPGAVTVA